MYDNYHDFHITGERDILSLKTLCDNASHGCKWVRELRSLDEHLASCDFTLLPCPNKCHRGREGKKSKHVQLLRKDLEKHIKECPRRQYECPYCQEAGEYWEMTTTHLDECPMIEVPCPKRQCKTSIARCDLAKHHQECLFEKVPCKYTIIGCKQEVLRKNLIEHEGDTRQHLQLAIDTVQQQQNMLAHLQSNQMPMKYRFTKYHNHKIANNDIFSPAFYTSPGGYKMCICVSANGDEEAEGTHVSVFAYLMKGENDDHLPWPFTGTVTVELLNQLENRNHYSRNARTCIAFPPDDLASQRVVNEERSVRGYGSPYYIAHSDLSYNSAKNCQYLKDDCLYFRINVTAKRSSKQWLV